MWRDVRMSGLAVCLLSLLGTIAKAQPDVPPAVRRPNAQARLQAQMKAAAQAQRQTFQQQMDLRLDHMQRCCQLSEDQARKLKVASKGAVEQAVAKSMRQWKQFRQGFGGAIRIFGDEGRLLFDGIEANVEVVPNDARPDDREPADPQADPPEPAPRAPADAIDADDLAEFQQDIAVAVNAAMPNVFFNGQQIAVDKEPLWKKAVDRILTEEQKKTYQAALKEQRKFRRDAGVRNHVAQLDQTLLLSPNQRKQVLKVIDESIGWRFERQNDARNAIAWELPAAGDQGLRQQMERLLSPAQFKQWERQFAGRNAAFQFWQQPGRFIIPPPQMPEFQFGNFDAEPPPDPNRPMLGISLRESDGKVIVISVIDDSPAAKAGLMTDDQIEEFDGKPVRRVLDVTSQTRTHKAGDEVQLRIKRDGRSLTLKAKLAPASALAR